ncbi:MAG: PRC-barrel domain-containing protein [Rhodomicrobium sp.]
MTALKTCFYAVLLGSFSGSALLAANAADEFHPDASLPASVTVVHNPESILGKRLIGAEGENAGRIVDVLADETGRVRAVIVDYGGFLGIGVRKIAVAWSDLRFAPAGHPDAVAVDLSSGYLARAPEVRAGQPVIAVTARRQLWHRAAQE